MPASPDHDADKLLTLQTSSQSIVSPEKVSPTFSSTDSLENQEKAVLPISATLYEENDDVVFLHGEPIVTTGKDISRFVVDIRDDGDDALTFRSFVLGTVLAALGAALSQVWRFLNTYIYTFPHPLCQIYLFKPVQVGVSAVFLLLIIYTFGNAWATCLPKRTLVEGTRFEILAPIFGFINPGAFTLKEVCCIMSLRPLPEPVSDHSI
jgi:hypothetical protein